jgi:hypothetical protein
MGKSFVLLFTFLIILAKSSAQTSIEYCGTLYYRNYRDEPGSIVFLKISASGWILPKHLKIRMR